MFEEGKVVEQGKYHDLMDKKQYFYKFVNGEKFKSVEKVAQHMLDKLVMKLLHVMPHG